MIWHHYLNGSTGLREIPGTYSIGYFLGKKLKVSSIRAKETAIKNPDTNSWKISQNKKVRPLLKIPPFIYSAPR